MSKAFTKEEGAAETPLRAPTASGVSRPITSAGFARLQREREALERQQRSLRARPSSEHEAQLRDVEARLGQLEAVLAQVVPQAIPPGADGRVVFGAQVTLQETGADTEVPKHYSLVGPDEADAREGRVSVQSPLGIALLGRHAGDTVLFERPRGEVLLTVLSVRYPDS